MDRLRLAFLGTPKFGVVSLRTLAEAGHRIVCVYTQPPRPADRGHRERRSAVHDFSAACDLPVRTPRSLRDKEEQRAFAALDVDAAVVAAYGLILPKPVLEAPRLGCLNVHASLLPRWRGAAPVQRALLAGDAKTGITIMQMDQGLDTGPIVLQGPIPIAATMTAGELQDRLAELGGRLVVDALAGLASGRLKPRPQPAEGITYANKLFRDEGWLDWRKPATLLERQVRAFAPWPGAFAEVPRAGVRERLKVLAAEVAPRDPRAAPGTLVDDGLCVACGEGALRLLMVQRAGKAAMDAQAFLRGFVLPAGTRLPLPPVTAP
jgi:methionyl-tRNA formyltransferase